MNKNNNYLCRNPKSANWSLKQNVSLNSSASVCHSLRRSASQGKLVVQLVYIQVDQQFSQCMPRQTSSSVSACPGRIVVQLVYVQVNYRFSQCKYVKADKQFSQCLSRSICSSVSVCQGRLSSSASVCQRRLEVQPVYVKVDQQFHQSISKLNDIN